MKCTVIEHPHCFGIELQPETLEEAATLIRLGMNATKEVRSVSASAFSDKTFNASVVLGKAKQSRAQVARGKW